MNENEREPSVIITCRVPTTMKGKAIEKAGRMKMNPNQFFAMLVERAVNNENSLFVERSELENANKQNLELHQKLSKVESQRIAEKKELTSLIESLNDTIETDKKQTAQIKALAIELSQKTDREREEHKKIVTDLKKQVSDLTAKHNKLVERINAANEYMRSQYLGKAKQF